MSRQYLINQTSEYRAKLAVIDAQIAQKDAERATIVATIEKIKSLIPLIQKRVDIRKSLHLKELGSTLQYYEMLQLLVEQQQVLSYVARISLDKTQMQVENKLVNLTPGMAVTADIRTGTRTIITYLLSPILKVAQESLRER